MFIKQVKIDGFKSYSTQSFKEDLSPELNIVVGSNGFGKSNFLNGKVRVKLSYNVCIEQ